MVLKLTSKQITEFIEYIKLVKPYSKTDSDKFLLIDDYSLNNDGRGTATMLKKLLDNYFKLYPDEDVYGYLDGSCFK